MSRGTDRDLFVRVLVSYNGGAEDPKGSNRGPFVEPRLRACGCKPGDPWCAAHVSMAGRACFGDDWPLPNTGSCDVMMEAARALGILVEEHDPQPGDVFFVMASNHDATHTGGVVKRYPDRSFGTSEGNAAEMGKQATREGTCVAARVRGTNADAKRYAFARAFNPDGSLRARGRA